MATGWLAAHVAMGKRWERSGHGEPGRWVDCADEDPLAWWCLTEAIFAFN